MKNSIDTLREMFPKHKAWDDASWVQRLGNIWDRVAIRPNTKICSVCLEPMSGPCFCDFSYG